MPDPPERDKPKDSQKPPEQKGQHKDTEHAAARPLNLLDIVSDSTNSGNSTPGSQLERLSQGVAQEDREILAKFDESALHKLTQANDSNIATKNLIELYKHCGGKAWNKERQLSAAIIASNELSKLPLGEQKTLVKAGSSALLQMMQADNKLDVAKRFLNLYQSIDSSKWSAERRNLATTIASNNELSALPLDKQQMLIQCGVEKANDPVQACTKFLNLYDHANGVNWSTDEINAAATIASSQLSSLPLPEQAILVQSGSSGTKHIAKADNSIEVARGYINLYQNADGVSWNRDVNNAAIRIANSSLSALTLDEQKALIAVGESKVKQINEAQNPIKAAQTFLGERSSVEGADKKEILERLEQDDLDRLAKTADPDKSLNKLIALYKHPWGSKGRFWDNDWVKSAVIIASSSLSELSLEDQKSLVAWAGSARLEQLAHSKSPQQAARTFIELYRQKGNTSWLANDRDRAISESVPGTTSFQT